MDLALPNQRTPALCQVTKRGGAFCTDICSVKIPGREEVGTADDGDVVAPAEE